MQRPRGGTWIEFFRASVSLWFPFTIEAPGK